MTVVQTKNGAIEGREKEGVLLFAGIPYASPPIGKRRFLPPIPVEPWEGVLKTKAFGHVAWQESSPLSGVLEAQELDCNEDCLFLNIQTPSLDDKRRAVMVWIHGGAFVGGSGSTPWYDGKSFVKTGDVVIVTINYRLGAFGFLSLGEILGSEYESSGLNGIQDQILALRWVKENISAFGGDPNNITIFGESAGAMSVGTILGIGEAKGLYHRAVLQSGSALNIASKNSSQQIAQSFVELGDLSDPTEILNLEASEIMEIQGKLIKDFESNPAKYTSNTGSIAGLPFQPSIDGKILSKYPMDAIRDGDVANIPLLIGTNKDEWKLFSLMYSNPDSEESIVKRINRMSKSIETDGTQNIGEIILKAYKEAFPAGSPSKLWEEILSDYVFRIPAIRLLEAQEIHQPNVYHYFFTWESPAFGGALGSSHAMEIPFVFNAFDKGGIELFIGNDPPVELSHAMQSAWIAFAKTGSPSNDLLPSEWKPFDTENRCAYEFGLRIGSIKDPRGETRAAWEGIR